jgi:hypothetical protein
MDEQQAFVSRLGELHKIRNARPPASTRGRALTTKQRETVRAKTDGHCHLCGGEVGDKFDADHVLAFAAGGKDDPAGNYLAAHHGCNEVRWHYLPEEFQLILRIGQWARNQIEHATPIGRDMLGKFLEVKPKNIKRREKNRAAR